MRRQILTLVIGLAAVFFVTEGAVAQSPDLATGLYSYFPMEDKTDILGFATTGDTNTVSYTPGLIENALNIPTDTDDSMIYFGSGIGNQDNTYRDVMYNDATVNVWVNIRSFNSLTDGSMSIISGIPGEGEQTGGCPGGINHWAIRIHNVPGCQYGGCPGSGGAEVIALDVSSHQADGTSAPGGAVGLRALEGNLSTNTWYMITVTHDSTTHTWKLYVNGNLEDSVTNSTGVGPGALTRACPYSIGDRPTENVYGMPFSGLIDEVGFWNRVLSEQELLRLYNNGAGLSYEDLEGSSDTTRPAAITNLTATTGSTAGTVDLNWKAPGDDGNTGTASNYIVRYATSAITTETAWAAATNVPGEPAPGPASTPEGMTVSGLTPGQTYYFAIKTRDEAPNTSKLSNSPSAVAGATVSISHIEVTQVTQDEYNNTVLIAGKPTLVRVYVDCLDCCEGCKLPDVTGWLEVTTSTRAFLQTPDNVSTEAYHPSNWTEQREDLNATLNFLIIEEFLSGTVSLAAYVGDAVWPEASLSFEPAKELDVIIVPIRYKGETPTIKYMHRDLNITQFIYPTAKINAIWYPTMDWYLCLETDWLACPKHLIHRWGLLKTLHLLYGDNDAFVYGWLPEADLGDFLGRAEGIGSGVAAIGRSDWSEWDTFAHELAHLMNQRHTNSATCRPDRIDPDSEWPYKEYHSFIQDYGVRLDQYRYPNFVIQYPQIIYDYMSYCGKGGYSKWTSDWTYTKTFADHFTTASAGTSRQDISVQASPYMNVSGLVLTDDTATLDPIWVIDADAPVGNPATGTQYCLEVQDSLEIPLASHCFDLEFLDYEAMKATDVDAFSIMLPYSAGVDRVVLKKGSQELAVQAMSANSPQITVTSPNGGEVWSANGTHTISWTGSDVDGDTLTYIAQYSPDGLTWVSVGNLTTDTQITVDASELAGGDNAIIRVLATDGFNTSSDESDAPFTVGRKGPQVYILSPETGSTILPGAALYFQGSAYDLEDGALGESALRWNSSQDGELGTGSLVRATLSEGQHVITLAATDSDNNTSTTTINVSVGLNSVYLPAILKNH